MTANIDVPKIIEGVTEVTPTATSSHNPTTKFADDTIGYEANPIGNVEFDNFAGEIVAKSSQTIIDYLERPSVLTSGTLAASDSGVLWIGDVTSCITPAKQTRMNNIFTFKSDFKITLQVNADRFQQGRYILFWLPTGGGTTPGILGSNLQWRKMHTCNLTKITQLPHVEIDLATQTHVTLNVPYASIYPMNSWSTDQAKCAFGLGFIGIVPYSPLNPGTGGSTTCGYTLWGSLCNIVIGSASFNQMDAGTREAEAMGVGPISGVLDKVAATADIFGKVPIIGSYAKTTSWGVQLLSKAAKLWGWSKPLAVAAPVRVDRKVTTFAAVSDVADYSKPLGVLAENSVAVPPSVITSYDEMSIDFIKSVPAFMTSAQWNSSQVSGSVVMNIMVTPSASTTWSKGVVHTPCSFLAQQFGKWRGAIKYKFKVVKTSFHRGRIMVAYFPGTISAVGTAMTNSEYVFREVVDISETSAFEVCCPYMVPQPWLSSFGSGLTFNSGTLIVYVVDSLVAPATVSSTVDILVEQFGGDDLQFAVPTVWQFEPYCPSTAQMAETYVETPCFELGPKINKPNDRIPTFTVGESVKSIRQLIKRNWDYQFQLTVGGGSHVRVHPYLVEPVMQADGTGGTLNRTYTYSDSINLWACAYAISYGAMRYHLKTNNSTNPTVTITAKPQTLATAGINNRTGSSWPRPSISTYAVPSIEGPIEFQTPNWNTALGRATPAQFANSAQGIVAVEPLANCTSVEVWDEFGPGIVVNLARAAAEDFGFSMFVGVPPVVAYNAT